MHVYLKHTCITLSPWRVILAHAGIQPKGALLSNFFKEDIRLDPRVREDDTAYENGLRYIIARRRP